FENKLKLDQPLSEMMTDMNLLVEGIKMSATQSSKEEKIDRLNFFNQINEIEKNAFEISDAKVVPLYRKPWILSAAASVILLVMFTFYFMREQAPVNER